MVVDTMAANMTSLLRHDQRSLEQSLEESTYEQHAGLNLSCTLSF